MTTPRPIAYADDILSAQLLPRNELLHRVLHSLLTYPHFVRVVGCPVAANKQNVRALARDLAAAASTRPGAPVATASDLALSFTTVRNDREQAARNDSVTRRSRTAQALPLHTDSSYARRPHDLIAFQMVEPDAHGGESIVAPIEDVLQRLDPDTVAALREAVYPFGERRFPVLHGTDRTPMIRYYEHQMSLSATLADDGVTTRHRDALAKLQATLAMPGAYHEFSLGAGEILLLNNHRALHGRSSFSASSDRVLYRVRAHIPALAHPPLRASRDPAPTKKFDSGAVRRLLRKREYAKAVARCIAHLTGAPDDLDALLLCARALRRDQRHREALPMLTRAASIAPNDAAVVKALGDLQLRNGARADAIKTFQHHRRLAPDSYGGGVALAALLSEAGDLDAAHAALGDVVKRHPFHSVGRQDLDRPTILRLRGLHRAQYGLVGNRKKGYRKLLQGGHFSIRALLNDRRYNVVVANVRNDNLNCIEPPRRFSLMLNTVSCPDLEGPSLRSIARFFDHHPDIPIINDPRGVIETARDRNYQRLAPLDGIEFPQTERVHWARDSGEADAQALARDIEQRGFHYPVILRRAGTQTGMSVRRCNTPAEVRDYFLSNDTEHDYYVIQFKDCIGPRNVFNKTRIFCIDGSYYPVANLFADQWQIHSGDRYRMMHKHKWMQKQERRYLYDPNRYLGTRVVAALEQIKDLVGLDFFGIDFCRQPNGSIFIFELNPAMRHNFDHADRFPYTRPHLERITQAFEAMVQRRIDAH